MAKKDIKVVVHIDVILTGSASSEEIIRDYFKDRKHPIFFDTCCCGKGDYFLSLSTGKNEQKIISITDKGERK